MSDFDCSIIVSGESGSGKSFCTQILIQHLLSLARTQETGIVASGPILENFGHAKTRRNFNSSRVGKFMRLDFSAAGRLTGAKVEQYLLEISRVIHRQPNERNFHIFYTLIYGLTEGERNRVGLRKPEDYEYLKHSDLSPVDDREEDDGRGIIKVSFYSLHIFFHVKFHSCADFTHVFNLIPSFLASKCVGVAGAV